MEGRKEIMGVFFLTRYQISLKPLLKKNLVSISFLFSRREKRNAIFMMTATLFFVLLFAAKSLCSKVTLRISGQYFDLKTDQVIMILNQKLSFPPQQKKKGAMVVFLRFLPVLLLPFSQEALSATVFTRVRGHDEEIVLDQVKILHVTTTGKGILSISCLHFVTP